MKLQLRANELLALHNLLHERVAGELALDDGRGPDGDLLVQIYNRLRSMIVGALMNTVPEKNLINDFLNREQSKIDKLKLDNEALTLQASEVAAFQSIDSEQLVPEQGEDYAVPDYPRKGFKPSQRNKGGGKR